MRLLARLAVAVLACGAVAGACGAQAAPAASPSVDQILDRWVQAVGGRAAIERLQTRVIRGRFVTGLDAGDPLELAAKDAGKWSLSLQFSDGPQRYFSDGTAGWVDGDGEVNALSPAEVLGFRVDYDVRREVRLREMFTSITGQGRRTVDGREAYVLEAGGPPGMTVWLHFDAESGLLVLRRQRRTSPEGTLSHEIRYEDYREVDGVRIPFRILRAGPNSSWTLQVEQVRHNVALEDARFAGPSGR